MMRGSPVLRQDQQPQVVLTHDEYATLVGRHQRPAWSCVKIFMVVLIGLPVAAILLSIAVSAPFLAYGLIEANDALREVAVAQAQGNAADDLNTGVMIGAGLMAAAILVIAMAIKGGK